MKFTCYIYIVVLVSEGLR